MVFLVFGLNEPAFLRSIKQKMIERFQRDWRIKLESSNIFSVYRTFKSHHQAEKYANDNKRVPRLHH